jgi:hypothetical protein
MTSTSCDSTKGARRAVLVLTLCATWATSGSAQQASPPPRHRAAHWGLTSALGYMALLGTAGAGLGVAANSLGGTAAGGVLGGIAGLIVGGNVGGAAVRDINEGRPVPPGRASAVRMGTLFCGVPVALATGFVLINSGNSSGTPLGSDESTLTLLVGAGIGVGAYYLHRHGGELRAPRLTVGRHRTSPGGHHAYDIGMQLTF